MEQDELTGRPPGRPPEGRSTNISPSLSPLISVLRAVPELDKRASSGTRISYAWIEPFLSSSAYVPPDLISESLGTNVCVRVTHGAAPCTVMQCSADAPQCRCTRAVAHRGARCNPVHHHRDAPRCRCTQVVVHRGARCNPVPGGRDAPWCTVHLGAWRCKKGKNAVFMRFLTFPVPATHLTPR